MAGSFPRVLILGKKQSIFLENKAPTVSLIFKRLFSSLVMEWNKKSWSTLVVCWAGRQAVKEW